MSQQRYTFYSAQTTEPRVICEMLAPTLDLSLIELAARKFVASLKDEALKTFNGRLDRGLELAKNGSVQHLAHSVRQRRFLVRSSDGKERYTVDLDTKTCDCPDSQKGNTCKHRIAAYYVEQAMKLTSAPNQLEASLQKTGNGTTPVQSQPQPVQPAQPVIQPLRPSQGVVQPVRSSPTITQSTLPTAQPVRPTTPITPTPEAKPQLSREEQLLKELGYAPEPRKVKEETRESSAQLGNLYRRYLHGSDIGQQEYQVTIQDVTREKVCPHPSQPVIEKWCLWVYGLPEGLPKAILFGTRGEDDLIAIFGKVSLETLKGKLVVIYAKPGNVGGQTKLSIRFRGMK